MNLENGVSQAFNHLNIETNNPNDFLQKDLGMDSQEVVSLMIELEKIFDIKLNMNDINRDMSVSEIIEVLKNKVS